MRGAEQARRAVHGRTEVVAVPRFGIAGGDRHAHRQSVNGAEIFAVQTALHGDRGLERIAGIPKRRAKCIADRFENVTTVALDLASQDLVVAAQRAAHRLAVRFPAPRASLDIRKEKDDRSRRWCCALHGIAEGSSEGVRPSLFRLGARFHVVRERIDRQAAPPMPRPTTGPRCRSTTTPRHRPAAEAESNARDSWTLR